MMRPVLLFSLLFMSAAAQAADFQVIPLFQILKPGVISSYTFVNHGTLPEVLQVSAVSWHQRTGAAGAVTDVYAPTHDLIIVPPVFQIPPGSTQTLRIAARVNPVREQAYRLIFQEVPPKVSPHGEHAGTVNTTLTLRLPVWVEPAESGPQDPVIAWTYRDGNLTARNTGTEHVHLDRLELGTWRWQQGAVYLLPGSSRSWTIPAGASGPSPAEQLQISWDTDGVIRHTTDKLPARQK